MVAVDSSTSECDIHWIDSAVPLERYINLHPYQKINHFPGMGEITRKDCLARNMHRMHILNKEEYNFAPRTWVLPADYGSLAFHMRDCKRKQIRKTLIVKPHNGARGKGIRLIHSVDEKLRKEPVIVQEYIENPLLIDGFKCDLRVYVLVTSCDPLSIFVHKDGLVRLSTQPYHPPNEGNLNKQFMHLTNYSINKFSMSYDHSDRPDKGSKRSLSFLNGWLRQNGYNVSELWSKIHDLIVKTLIVAYPSLSHTYNACRPPTISGATSQCFEILGFDILLDHTLKPWLLEVNRSPSFGTDTDLDWDIKFAVIKDALQLLNIRPTDKHHTISRQKAASRKRLLHLKCKGSRIPCGQEGSLCHNKQKREELKERLIQLSEEKEENDEVNLGNYVRVFPTPNPERTKVYNLLLGKTSRHPVRWLSSKDSIRQLQESDVKDLLMQYEDEFTDPRLNFMVTPTNLHHNPLSPPRSKDPPNMGMSAAMALREREEEQTQLTMVALNETKPFYPGKRQDEVQAALQQANVCLKSNLAKIADFWHIALSNMKRKELLDHVKDKVKRIMSCYWRTNDLKCVHLDKLVTRLFLFLLSNNGKGFWVTFVSQSTVWEQQFKAKVEALSMVELACCRRIVQLCHNLVTLGYYYHMSKPDLSSELLRSRSVVSIPARRHSTSSAAIRPDRLCFTKT